MKPDLIQSVSKMPSRQLHLLLGGILLVVTALLWTYAVRAPLAALRAAQDERSRLENGELNASLLDTQRKALDAEVAALSKGLGLDVKPPPPAQLLLGLIGDMNALAQAHRVTLSSANPAATVQTLVFDEVGFDAEATGSYAALLAWLQAVETARPNVAVVRFEMTAAKAEGQVELKARIAAYLPREVAP